MISILFHIYIVLFLKDIKDIQMQFKQLDPSLLWLHNITKVAFIAILNDFFTCSDHSIMPYIYI